MNNLYDRFINWLNIEQRDNPVTVEHDYDELIENWRLDSEDLESLHANLDREGIPRYAGENEDQEEYSAWGRVLRFVEKQTGQTND